MLERILKWERVYHSLLKLARFRRRLCTLEKNYCGVLRAHRLIHYLCERLQREQRALAAYLFWGRAFVPPSADSRPVPGMSPWYAL